MTLGASLFLIGVGAILRFAVTATFAGIDIQVVGTILMVIERPRLPRSRCSSTSRAAQRRAAAHRRLLSARNHEYRTAGTVQDPDA